MNLIGYTGKVIKITTTDGMVFSGKAVELFDPKDSYSGELEIGINYAGGIRTFAESEVASIEVL